ncbi:TIGR01777 family oxidoreductase [Paenibacillus puldeungensis]|uniref:TIGR01777 family oxidoreductase n=1 Tax=Paenibacillus puldeungensis TaxID=696536 RepID=A0ABW3RU51_9BACL
MKAAIFGGTGLIGQALTSFWLKQGHKVVVITRNPKGARLNEADFPSASNPTDNLLYISWEELKEDTSLLEGVNVVVNLAGATLNQRWTAKGKRCILGSRIDTTNAAALVIQSLNHKPNVVVQASAVGIYGTSLTEQFDETTRIRITAENADFLTSVTTQWEDAAEQGFSGIRLIKLRTGVVLSNDGGAYPLMRLPFLLGVGGKIGSGKQWVPWIHIQDLVSIIDFCISQPSLSGPVNAVSPHPVSNEEFGRMISRIYRRPFWFPLPSFLLKGALGEMSSLLLEGQKVLPSSVLKAGFAFSYPELEQAVRQLQQ